MTAEIGRCKLFASDRLEFVTEGEDENGHKVWRTYVGMTKPDGQIMFYLATLAYSPPNDWPELGLPPGQPVSGHANTIRRYLRTGQPTGKESAALDALEAELVRQADRIAWLEGEVAGWRIKLAECEAELQTTKGSVPSVGR